MNSTIQKKENIGYTTLALFISTRLYAYLMPASVLGPRQLTIEDMVCPLQRIAWNEAITKHAMRRMCRQECCARTWHRWKPKVNKIWAENIF